jgi:F0F1-type ATP synthase assembly protein I
MLSTLVSRRQREMTSLHGSAMEEDIMPKDFKPSSGKSSWQETLRTVLPYTHMGMTFAITVAALTLAGHWADNRFGTAPWLLLVGAILGIAIGFYHFLKAVLRH